MEKRLTFLMTLLLILVTSCQKEDLRVSQYENENLVMYAQENGEIIPGKYILVLKEEGNLKSLQQLTYQDQKQAVRTYANQVLSSLSINPEKIEFTYAATIQGFSCGLEDHERDLLEKDDRIAYIENDRLIVNKPPWAGGGDGSTEQEIPYGISRVGGPVNYNGNNVAWILDTGIDLDHPDLNVNASKGFNVFSKGKDAKSLDDGNGHGTHIAGTIAAIDNEEGVIGVAAGATVIPVKVLNSRGTGTYSGIIAGVDFVGANGSNGDVANMSLSGPASQALDDAVIAASLNEIFFTLAAGNASDDANNYSPARSNGDYIFTISAMDNEDNWAGFSNYGNPPIDYCAPGVKVKSTYKDGSYRSLSGTSMAAPHAAGIFLVTNGNPNADGFVSSDPDGKPDPIIHN